MVFLSLSHSRLNVFINKLVDYSNSDRVDNQYKNELQRNNLRYYLMNMDLIHPSILFVGEAPGYQGCAITGVPFTSESIVMSHKNSSVLNGCICLGNQKEPTATMIWGILDEKEREKKLVKMPLMWNIFPFHPIDNGCIKTNRKPNDDECEFGYNILNELLTFFPYIEEIYAVGKTAEKILVNHKHPKYKSSLRHPSNGGKQMFKSGIDIIYP